MCSIQRDTEAEESLRWLAGFEQYGWVFGLERITSLMEKLGNPQKRLQVIHVGGTNGKGSVCQYIGSILEKAGYSVGRYLSPHVEHFSERIVVNGVGVSDDELVSLVTIVKPFVEEMKAQGNPPTYFEVVTALAFVFFNQRGVDFAVVEVGLGGRLDATNIVRPLVSVITNISLEHTDILGKTIEKIAFEKAGIIKEHVPVVTAASDEALVVIKRVAAGHGASVVVVDAQAWERLSWDGRCQEFLVRGAFRDYTVQTVLPGVFQGENIAVAVAAVELLQVNGVFLSDDAVAAGVASASNPGRLEVVSEHPTVLLDGAHNPDAMRRLAETLTQDFSYERLILVLGILKDKDIQTILSIIVPIATIIIATRSSSPRAMEPQSLKESIERIDPSKNVIVEASIPAAVDHAKTIAKKGDLICVSGSLFTVGEARTNLVH